MQFTITLSGEDLTRVERRAKSEGQVLAWIRAGLSTPSFKYIERTLGRRIFAEKRGMGDNHLMTGENGGKGRGKI